MSTAPALQRGSTELQCVSNLSLFPQNTVPLFASKTPGRKRLLHDPPEIQTLCNRAIRWSWAGKMEAAGLQAENLLADPDLSLFNKTRLYCLLARSSSSKKTKEYLFKAKVHIANLEIHTAVQSAVMEWNYLPEAIEKLRRDYESTCWKCQAMEEERASREKVALGNNAAEVKLTTETVLLFEGGACCDTSSSIVEAPGSVESERQPKTEVDLVNVKDDEDWIFVESKRPNSENIWLLVSRE